MNRRIAGWIARIAGTAAGVIYVATLVTLDELGDAISRLPITAFAVATALVLINVVASTVRWRFVLAAYGAARVPAPPRMFRLYLVSFFYNTYLPGAVVGDVVRGVVTRDAFPGAGATSAVAVVLVERALGLAALFGLVGIGVLWWSDAARGAGVDIDALTMWTWIGLGACAIGVAAIAGARRLSRVLPGALGRLAGRLPVLEHPLPFAAACTVSIAAQALIAIAGYALLRGLDSTVDLASSLLVVPLAAATTFLPITVGGAGAREAVFVALGAEVWGMPRADALAASLGLFAAHLVVGAIGGVVQLVAPLSDGSRSSTAS
jgi:uncharacterized membrane protein YbhN (UPF0104 family)